MSDRCCNCNGYFRNQATKKRYKLSLEYCQLLQKPELVGSEACNSCYQRLHKQYKKSPLLLAHQHIEKIEDKLSQAEDKLEEVRIQKKAVKKTSDNRKRKNEQDKRKIKQLTEQLNEKGSGTYVKNSRITAGDRGKLSASCIIESQNRPNRIEITLFVLICRFWIKLIWFQL